MGNYCCFDYSREGINNIENKQNLDKNDGLFRYPKKNNSKKKIYFWKQSMVDTQK